MMKKSINLLFFILLLVPMLSYAEETLEEESARRLPPVLYSLEFPEKLISGDTVTIKWSIMGYHNSYKSLVAFFDCSSATNCGASYSSNFGSSGMLTSTSSETATWSHNGNYATLFHYEYSFTPLHVTNPTDIVVRFYRINSDDENNNKSGLSLLMPGKISDKYYDTSGRKIMKKVYPNGVPLHHPCFCRWSGEYDRRWHGDSTNHLAQDYPAFVGDEVKAIADGQVYAVYDNIGGFGGTNPSRAGSAIVIRHKKLDGTIFFALYGHTHAKNDLTENDFVKGGEVIGTVGHYYYGNGTGTDWPHLHFGIWDSENNFPTQALGYGSDRNFVDPVPFLRNNSYQPWTN